MTPQLKIKEIFFRLKLENEAIKDRIIRDMGNLFEHEEGYYKPVKVAKRNVIWNMKVAVIEIKHYQLKRILIKLWIYLKRYYEDVMNDL